jgi:hypothetical protein
VLKPRGEQAATPPTPPPAASNGAEEKHIPATAKQKAFLKYLGAEFGENLAKERAALAVSDALETPKLQVRIRKWHDDKLRLHPELYQDEIDYRRANRSNRYLERIQTEGAEVLKDVTKAHVQVLVESLDKRHPGWEAEQESALWDHLFPAVGEHFPQLVLPAYKASLKHGSGTKRGSSVTRGIATAGGAVMPPPATGTLGAMLRGVVFGAIALGAIIAGNHFWQQSRSKDSSPAPATPAPGSPEKKEANAAANAGGDPAPKEPAAPLPDKLLAEAKTPDPAPAAPNEPAVPALNTEKPAAPAAPAMPEEKPAPAAPPMNAEKPAAPAAPEEKPVAPAPAEPAAMTPPAAPAQRTAVKLTQGIGVMLSNGQVTLPAGTPLRYLGIEGANVRVSWNNNVFFVPALATDVNEPLPAPGEPAATPAAPGSPPGEAKPKKPADDL